MKVATEVPLFPSMMLTSPIVSVGCRPTVIGSLRADAGQLVVGEYAKVVGARVIGAVNCSDALAMPVLRRDLSAVQIRPSHVGVVRGGDIDERDPVSRVPGTIADGETDRAARGHARRRDAHDRDRTRRRR